MVRFIEMAVMRRFLTHVPFTDQSLRKYAESDDLKMSVFEYAYRNKDIVSAIGIECTKQGQLKPDTLSPEKVAAQLPDSQRDALEYVLGQFHAGNLNTRSPEFKKPREEV